MVQDKKSVFEKEIVGEMILLYCRGNKHSPNGMCPSCAELQSYAWQRTDNCPYMETKDFCSNCETHCYKPEMRERIRKVMRYSGPRMVLSHPILLIKHIYYSRKS